MKLYAFLVYLIVFPSMLVGQSISGVLTELADKEIKLEGFNGFKTYLISSTKIDKTGKFSLHYNHSDYGVGYITTSENKPFLVILSNENVTIHGRSLTDTASIAITNGKENQWFEQFAKERAKREQAMSAWTYLEKLYATDPLFQNQFTPIKAIEMEQLRLTKEEAAFSNLLPQDSYLYWFLPIRKVVGSLANIAQYRQNEIAQTIQFLREIEYSDQRLYKSGLLKDVLEGHFWLLENSGHSPEAVTKEMKISIDQLFKKLENHTKILNEVTDYLFNLLEKHSFFEAAEYLSFKALSDGSCTVDDDLTRHLETYRTMKVGNTASDIQFDRSHFVAENKSESSLLKIKAAYKLMIFGASWCPNCKTDYPALLEKYELLHKKYSIEFIYISLDSDKNQCKEFYNSSPFIAYCDGKGWETKAAKDYHVFGTPTYLLLDSNLKILVKLKSPDQLYAWMENYGKQKNQ